MGQFELAGLPPHASYSSFTSYLQCGERYRLEKVVKIPETPAWWFLGGTAVHSATEAYDLGTDLSVRELFLSFFEEEIARQKKHSDVPEDEWRASGKPTKANPRKQDRDWWRNEGPVMVQAWIDWRQRSGWQVWTTPDGDQAIELALNVEMGGIPVKMHIDRIMVTPAGQLVVVDIKSGASEPDNCNQLGLYACGVELAFGLRPSLGGYWMARKGETGQVWDLEHLTPALEEIPP